jgi:hypothetical protein
MNELQIEKILARNRKSKRHFLGVFAADELPEKAKKYPHCFVANTDPHWKRGQHWVALWITSPKKAEYFCSLGKAPNPQFKTYLSNFQHVQTNEGKQIQANNETTCGQFCIFFLLSRAEGQTFDQIIGILWRTRAMGDYLVKHFMRTLIQPI